MNAFIVQLVYRKKLLLLLTLSTNIFLMSQEGYYNTPRFIPRSQLGNITEANQYILTPYSFSLNTNGYPDRMYFKGDSLCFSADISVSSFRGSHRFVENTKRIESSSFFCRSSHESQLYSGGQKTGELFTLIEGFKDSPRLYCYSRMVFSSVDTVVIKLTFTLPKTINSTTCTTKNIANIPAGKHTTVSSVQSATTRSTYAHSDQKLLLIFPKGYPHIRSWSKEYFTVDTSINSSTNNVDSSLTITFDTIIVAPGQTFDHMFIVAITDIECGNIFTDELLEKFGFYSPVEGYSTRRFTGIKGFEFLPAKAWTWGWATFPNQYMKYLLTKNDSLYHGYFLDEKIRHFVYFLEHQSKYGLIPFALKSPTFIRQTKNVDKIFTDFMFSQSGVKDVEYAVQFIKNLNDSDKFNIYKRLSKIKRLYDVSDTLGWIVDLGSSGYWFEYSNLWNYENYHPFIVNTHVTALHIANDLGRLALIMSDTVTFNFWRVIVDQGLKGFYYFINDSLNWKSNQSGRRELVYKKGDVSLDEYSDVTIEEFNDLKEELIATDYLPQIEEILFIKYHH